MNKRQQVLRFIKDYVHDYGIAPSLREIGNGTGIRSTSAVAYNLRKLEAEGYIKRYPKIPRGIKLIQDSAPCPHCAAAVTSEAVARDILQALVRWDDAVLYSQAGGIDPDLEEIRACAKDVLDNPTPAVAALKRRLARCAELEASSITIHEGVTIPHTMPSQTNILLLYRTEEARNKDATEIGELENAMIGKDDVFSLVADWLQGLGWCLDETPLDITKALLTEYIKERKLVIMHDQQAADAQERLAPMPCGHPGACTKHEQVYLTHDHAPPELLSEKGEVYCAWCAEVAALRDRLSHAEALAALVPRPALMYLLSTAAMDKAILSESPSTKRAWEQAKNEARALAASIEDARGEQTETD